MSGHTFNSAGFGPYSFDHQREAFYRQQEQERKERDHVLRAAQWFAGQLVGLPLTSLEQTYALCRELAETRYGRDRVEAMAVVVRKAATLCWLAEVQRATTDPLPVPEVTEQPRTVTYRPAA
jgi:hypothetical protein